MLSMQVKPINNPKDAARYYFSKDNYYFTGELSAAWHGLGADKLNLKENVTVEALESLLGGMLPNGEIIGLKSQSGEIKHRGGYDLTFSAPKSVSWLALVGGHQEFIDLHINAVKKVLNLIEKEAAEARKSGKDGIEYEKTGNLCFATILHDTSREQDPQLHIHALLMNATERLDGKWRALASDITRNHGTMEWIMNNQIFLGLVYRSEIAMGLKSMGLEAEATGDAHGLFEIKHFDKTLLESSSKRRAQIESQIEGMHSRSMKAYDRATMDTRKGKGEIDPAALRERWKAESEALGINPETYLARLQEKSQIDRVKSGEDIAEHRANLGVKEAIAHLSEQKLTFDYQELLQTSLYFSLGSQGYDSLIQSIDGEIKSQNLISLNSEDTKFTTQALLNKERKLIEQLDAFSVQKKSIPRDAGKITALTDNESIQKAVTSALFHKEGIVRIKQHGTSHEVLKTLIDYAESSKTVRVLSPNSATANRINKDTAKSPHTLWQWLVSIGKSDIAETVTGFNHRNKDAYRMPFFKTRKERELLIIDESQRLSPDDLGALLDIADKRAAKVILLEKTRSLTGFKSDTPGLIDKAQVKTLSVDDKPQQTANIELVEIKEKNARIQNTARHFVSQNSNIRRNTAVLAASRLETLELNNEIRAKLKEAGELALDEITVPTLTRLSLTGAELKLAQSYQPNWVIIQSSRHQFKKYTILGVHEKENRLTLKDEDGLVSHIPAKNMSNTAQVYEQTALKVSVGDKLMATGNLTFERIKTGAHFEVNKISQKGMMLQQGKNKTWLPFESDKPLPFAHSYAKSLYSHDFKKVENTIITLPAYALRQNTLALLSETSQKELTIITDDAVKARRYAEKLSVGKSAVSQVLESARQNHGVVLLGEETSHELLDVLDKAILLLTGSKPEKSAGERALQFAVAHMSEREAAFKRTDLLAAAMKKAIGQFSVEEVYDALETVMSSGQLIQGKDDLLTTKDALAMEQDILSTVKAGKGAVKPFLDIEVSRQKLADSRLTQSQKEACELITTTNDRFIAIQGYAGTGKTTMTKTAIKVIEEAKSLSPGVEILAVAPTHQAVKEMRALGIQAQTLKSFLIEQEQEQTLTEKTLVLLDESSMVSNRDSSKFVKLIHTTGARAVFLGDIQQHQSIESGKPLQIMLQQGDIKMACMDNIVRQQVEGYREAVKTLVKGDTDKALVQFSSLPVTLVQRSRNDSPFAQFSSSIIETGNSDLNKASLIEKEKGMPASDKALPPSPLEAAVHDYLSRTRECRDETIVVIHENKQRVIANSMIREALMKEGSLGRENKEFSRLVSTNYTTAELYFCETYLDALGDGGKPYVRRNNQYYAVTHVDIISKVVKLQDESGKESLFMPEKENKDWKLELFQLHQGNLSVGEKIQFKKSDKNLARFANERLQVIHVTDENFTVKDQTGLEHILKKDEMKDHHWDYSYTATSYSIQGASSPFVIGVADTRNEKVNHLRSFYIMVTRGSQHAMIYTDNYNKLQKQIRVIPEKTSAMEVLNLIDSSIKSQPYISQQKTMLSELKDQKTSIPIKKESYDASLITQNLSFNAENIIESLLGEPNRALSSKNEYRYGRKGSLSICLTGDKRGTWYNFETEEKGNLLHLIQHTLGLDFKSSLSYAANLLGDDIKKIQYPVQMAQQPVKIKNNKTKEYALKLAKESTPVNATLAEKYLKDIRNITHVTGENIRFHPRVSAGKNESVKYHPALLCIARDSDQKIQSVQAIYLDKETANKVEIKTQKRSYGNIKRAGLILSKGQNKDCVTYLTEGVETGLSIRDAVPNERVITLLGKSNMAAIDTRLLTGKVVMCLDNDGKPVHEDKLILRAIERFNLHGIEVQIAVPSKKGDFNDIAQLKGVSGVVEALSKSTIISPSSTAENVGSISAEQIKMSIKRLECNLKKDVDLPNNKDISQEKEFQRVEMEIC